MGQEIVSGGLVPRPLKCPHDKTILQDTTRGAWCSHCFKYFQTDWEPVPDPKPGEPARRQLLVEVKH
ncbi:MAG: hypothetical protein HYT22_01725 [Candidatus Niyogibacteria bacterium]|nr:hypothetical protein [Candidatus Niyogibacteria bacterium]